MTTATVRPREPDLERFDRVERTVHWATASLFLILMATGAALYAGPVGAIVGRRDLVRTIHVVAGIALPVPLLVGALGRWGAGLRACDDARASAPGSGSSTPARSSTRPSSAPRSCSCSAPGSS
jgi:cytochrome b561